MLTVVGERVCVLAKTQGENVLLHLSHYNTVIWVQEKICQGSNSNVIELNKAAPPSGEDGLHVLTYIRIQCRCHRAHSGHKSCTRSLTSQK